MISFQAVSRDSLVGIFGLGQAFAGTPTHDLSLLSRHALGPNDVLLVAPGPVRAGAFPSLLILPARSKQDFFAWSSSYLSAFRPLTSLCRVITQDELEASEIQSEAVPPQLPLIGAAAVIGEMLAMSAAAGLPARFTPHSCSFSLMNLCMRAIILGHSPTTIMNAVRQWSEIRASSEASNLASSLVNSVVPIMLELRGTRANSGPIRYVGDLLRMLIDGQPVDVDAFHRVARQNPGSLYLLFGTDTSREQRLVEFRSMLLELRKSPDLLSDVSVQFAIGHALSRVSMGSVDHAALLEAMCSTWPGVMVWYSVCSAIADPASFYRVNSGLPRRLARDLIRVYNVADAPECDIAIDELRTLQVTEGRHLPFLGDDQPWLKVEFAPGAMCVVPSRPEVSTRVPKASEASRRRSGNLRAEGADDAALVAEGRYVFDQLRRSIAEARGILTRLDERGGASVRRKRSGDAQPD